MTVIVLSLLIFFSSPALAINLIRDAEIEKTLHDYGAPIFKAARINPDDVKIYIVNEDSINAFTAGGLNLFVNTGLILRADSSNMIIGVMAHETGHIVGGHLIKRMGEVDNLTVETILTTVLGAAVTVAGLPNAGMGVIAAGQHVAERNYASFSRQQEVSADAAAIKFLNATHQSAGGMLKLFEILRRDQTLTYGSLDPYAISHPLSQDRVEHVRSEIMISDIPQTDNFASQHTRMVAKLHGFLEKPEITFLKYTDESVPSLYARSIAYFKQSNFTKSFAELDKLLALQPNDPFFNELKGQFLSESGHPRDAIVYYEKADNLYPKSSLIKTELGKVLLDSGKYDEAVNKLSQSSQLEPTNAETWHLLATAYGKKGNEALSNLMLAEEANVMGKNDQARQFARLAKDGLTKNSPGWIRANDILADIKLHKKQKKQKDPDQ